jgi:hypothetical protein
LSDSVGDGVERSRRGFSDEAFEFGEDLLDRVEVGRVSGKKQETRPDGLDGVSHRFSFVGAEVVEDHDVAWLEGRDKELFDIARKRSPLIGPSNRQGAVNPILAKSGEERRRLPTALRDLVDGALASAPSREALSCWFSSRSHPGR